MTPDDGNRADISNKPENPVFPQADGSTCWVFDLDNTLYSTEHGLFSQIDNRMGEYIARTLGMELAEARKVQKDFFVTHGTTLKGLTEDYGIDAHDFLEYVHDVDISNLPPDVELKKALAALPGEKYIFTNGPVSHANRILKALDITTEIDGIFDIAHADFVPKPWKESYQSFTGHFDIDPVCAIMVEDMVRNLVPAAELGMTTVWLKTKNQWGALGYSPQHVHYEIEDLTSWLKKIAAQGKGSENHG